MIYFAYGSNLSHKQITKRCPTAKFLGPATLSGYEFIFSGYSPRWGSSVANIVEADGETVSGGLFEMSDEDIKTLDGLEGSQKYSRVRVTVDIRGKMVSAVTYSSPNTDEGKPGADYIETMVLGAKDCGIPYVHLSSRNS